MTDESNLAPVALFVFNRPKHTSRSLEALSRNYLASKTELVIFSDGSRNAADETEVATVRNVIRNEWGFAKTSVIERNENLGLSTSIVQGVSDLLVSHEKIIVLEDDILTGRYFLSFMNNGLQHFADESRLMHISGWNYPIRSDDLEEAFLWRGMNCWGWATWKRAWRYFKRDFGDISSWERPVRHRFDFDGGTNNWQQLKLNKAGKLSTWAIFWYLAIFRQGGLCLNPSVSLTENIGLDGTGTHSISGSFRTKAGDHPIRQFPQTIEENPIVYQRIRRFLKRQKLMNLPRRILSTVMNS